MDFRQIASRLTGITIWVFGVSWTPTEAEREVAKRVITYLEDRRVLYRPESMEIASHCIESVITIREFLTAELGKIDVQSELTPSLRAMRLACRKFLDALGTDRQDIEQSGFSHGHWASWRFMGALGELRGVFGIHIAVIAVKFGVPVENELAGILPADESADRDLLPNDLRRAPRRRSNKA